MRLRDIGRVSRVAGAIALGLALTTTSVVPASAVTVQEPEGQASLVRVVGCLRADGGDLPWVIERAGEPAAATTAYTSDEEVEISAAQPLGAREFRLIGAEFDVAAHEGHKVQAKGLLVNVDDEWRLNLTSFQHVAPTCEG